MLQMYRSQTSRFVPLRVHPAIRLSLLFSRAFAIGRHSESEVRADRSNGGANRAGDARTFEDAVARADDARDRLTHTVVGGSVERVVEEVVERCAPIPEHVSTSVCRYVARALCRRETGNTTPEKAAPG